MDKGKILQEAKNYLDDYDIKDFEQLKSAIESKKIYQDIEGSRFQKLTTFITSLTALITVVVLIWQSGGASQKDHSDILDKHIATIKTDIENKESKLVNLQTRLDSIKLNTTKARTNYDNLKKEIIKLQDEQIDINQLIDDKKANIGGLTVELNSLGNQIDARKGDDALIKANELLRNEASQNSLKVKELNASLNDKISTIQKLNNDKIRAEETISKLKPYETILDSLEVLSPQREFEGHKRNDPREVTVNLKNKEQTEYKLVFDMLNTGNIKKNMDISIKVVNGAQMRYVNLAMGSYTLLRPDESKELSIILYVKEVNEPSRSTSDEWATYELYFIGKKILTTY